MQRLIGNFGYSDVMRSLDGVQVGYANGDWNFTAVSAIPTERAMRREPHQSALPANKAKLQEFLHRVLIIDRVCRLPRSDQCDLDRPAIQLISASPCRR